MPAGWCVCVEMRSVTVSSSPRRCNNSPRKQSGHRIGWWHRNHTPAGPVAIKSWLGYRANASEKGWRRSDGRHWAVGRVRNTGGGRQRDAREGLCVFRGWGGQCKCYCCVSSFDQSPGKVKRIQSGFVWQSGDTGAGEETPRTENGLSYWLWSSRGLRRTVYSARNAFRQQLALITFIDFSGSVPRI